MIIDPSWIRSVHRGTATTQGTPYSRATMAQWARTPPVSATMAATRPNSGDHADDVILQTSTSPLSILAASPRVLTTFASARTRPARSETSKLYVSPSRGLRRVCRFAARFDGELSDESRRRLVHPVCSFLLAVGDQCSSPWLPVLRQPSGLRRDADRRCRRRAAGRLPLAASSQAPGTALEDCLLA